MIVSSGSGLISICSGTQYDFLSILRNVGIINFKSEISFWRFSSDISGHESAPYLGGSSFFDSGGGKATFGFFNRSYCWRYRSVCSRASRRIWPVGGRNGFSLVVAFHISEHDRAMATRDRFSLTEAAERSEMMIASFVTSRLGKCANSFPN